MILKNTSYIYGLNTQVVSNNLRKDSSTVKGGLSVFQEFADIYNDSINDINAAE